MPTANNAILIRPMKTLITAWRSMPRTTPRKNMPSWVMDGRWKIEDGRWGKVDSLEQEASFTANGHGEDHPDEQAADDVLEALTKYNDNKGQWINHRSWKVEGGRWKGLCGR